MNSSVNYRLVKRLIQEDQSGSGYCTVPKEVTKKLRNPIEFYEGSLTFGEYTEADFGGIGIDTEAHQDLIQKFSGGRQVALERQCFYFFENNEWEASKGNFHIVLFLI